MPISASPARSLSPTALSSGTRCEASSRSVRPPFAATRDGLLDADEVRVEGLVTVMELDLDVGVRLGDVLADTRGVGGVGLGADDDRDQLRVAVEEHVDQCDGRIARRLHRRGDAVARDGDPITGGDRTALGDAVTYGARDLAGANAGGGLQHRGVVGVER